MRCGSLVYARFAKGTGGPAAAKKPSMLLYISTPDGTPSRVLRCLFLENMQRASTIRMTSIPAVIPAISGMLMPASAAGGTAPPGGVAVGGVGVVVRGGVDVGVAVDVMMANIQLNPGKAASPGDIVTSAVLMAALYVELLMGVHDF